MRGQQRTIPTANQQHYARLTNNTHGQAITTQGQTTKIHRPINNNTHSQTITITHGQQQQYTRPTRKNTHD